MSTAVISKLELEEELAGNVGSLVTTLMQLNRKLGGPVDGEITQLQKLIDEIKEKLKAAADGDVTSESFARQLKGGRPDPTAQHLLEHEQFLEGFDIARKRRAARLAEHSGDDDQAFVEPSSSSDFARQLTGGRR